MTADTGILCDHYEAEDHLTRRGAVLASEILEVIKRRPGLHREGDALAMAGLVEIGRIFERLRERLGVDGVTR